MKLKYKQEYTILITTVLLALIGIVMIYSASSYTALLSYGDAFFFVKKQAIALVAGIVMMIVGCKLNLDLLKKMKWVIYIMSVVILALVFIPGLGVESYGATRWIDLGFTTFQPSELAKFGLMIFLAAYMADKPPTSFKSMIIPLIAGLIICVLVMMEPNMSITICIGMALILVLFIGGSPKKLFILMIICVAIAIPLLIVVEPYRLKRIMAFINPWENPKDEGYQLIQSYYALGSGGLFGVGLFSSRQKYLFLPFAESDFIFSVIGEELGLVGCIVVIGIFALLIYSGFKVAFKAKNRYHTMLATGLTAVIALQTLINIAVVSGSMPPTGVPLPYISFGGTSLMVFMFVSGLLYNIGSVTNRALSP
jgi:cell division protein FtsW